MGISSFFLRFYLFTFRERGREGETEGEKQRERNRGRETSMCCCCLSCAPYWGPRPQPRHVPWLGIEPMTLWSSGRHSIHWATPARAVCAFLCCWRNSSLLGCHKDIVLYFCLKAKFLHSLIYIELIFNVQFDTLMASSLSLNFIIDF